MNAQTKAPSVSPYHHSRLCPLKTRRRMQPHDLWHALNRPLPRHPRLYKLLYLQPQLRLGQREVVHGAREQDGQAWEQLALAVHERAVRVVEVVGHTTPRAGGLGLRERLEPRASPHMAQVRLRDGDIGHVKCGANLEAVAAVAGVAVDEAGALDGPYESTGEVAVSKGKALLPSFQIST